MNLIDQIEYRREKEGITVKDLCDQSKVSQSSYSRYRAGEIEPNIPTVTKLMGVVGLKLVTMDEDMVNVHGVPEWGKLSLYVDANLVRCCTIFKDLTGVFFVSSSFYFTVLRTALLSVWFHKSNQKTAKQRFLSDVIMSEHDLDSVITQAKDWGLLNVDNSPSSSAYEFYFKVVISMQEYLSESNVICKVS